MAPSARVAVSPTATSGLVLEAALAFVVSGLGFAAWVVFCSDSVGAVLLVSLPMLTPTKTAAMSRTIRANTPPPTSSTLLDTNSPLAALEAAYRSLEARACKGTHRLGLRSSFASHTSRIGYFLSASLLENQRVDEEEAILDEAMENLGEVTQRLRAIRNRLWAAGAEDRINYLDLAHRVSSALAMTEAASLEARRRRSKQER